jgi:hypothetical protein
VISRFVQGIGGTVASPTRNTEAKSMPRHLSLVLLAGAALLGWLTPAAATPSKTPFKVRTSLDGKTVLPHRIRWLGYPLLPRNKVQAVTFLIDGKVRWVEQNPPYSYSDDGGYLVTSWLSPGLHRFTVRATSFTGATASKTVVARVVAAPEPSAELAGRWQRDIADEVPGPSDPRCAPDPVPAGRWTLVFESRWIESVFPGPFHPQKSKQTHFGYIIDNDWVPGPNTFEVAGSVTINLIRDQDKRGGWWCLPDGPAAKYSWAVDGDTLSLAPVGGVDPNEQRGAVFTGKWTRVH